MLLRHMFSARVRRPPSGSRSLCSSLYMSWVPGVGTVPTSLQHQHACHLGFRLPVPTSWFAAILTGRYKDKYELLHLLTSIHRRPRSPATALLRPTKPLKECKQSSHLMGLPILRFGPERGFSSCYTKVLRSHVKSLIWLKGVELASHICPDSCDDLPPQQLPRHLKDHSLGGGISSSSAGTSKLRVAAQRRRKRRRREVTSVQPDEADSKEYTNLSQHTSNTAKAAARFEQILVFAIHSPCNYSMCHNLF